MGLESVCNIDLYEMLEVRPDATDATSNEIILAHRRLIKLHHPDVGGNESRACAVNFGRDVLADPAQRRRYDQLRAEHLAIHGPAVWPRTAVPASVVTSTPVMTSTLSTGVGTELFGGDIRDALRSDDWLGALGLAFTGYIVDRVVSNATADLPVARVVVDVLAGWMRGKRVAQDREARIARVKARIARLEGRARAAARKPIRKKR